MRLEGGYPPPKQWGFSLQPTPFSPLGRTCKKKSQFNSESRSRAAIALSYALSGDCMDPELFDYFSEATGLEKVAKKMITDASGFEVGMKDTPWSHGVLAKKTDQSNLGLAASKGLLTASAAGAAGGALHGGAKGVITKRITPSLTSVVMNKIMPSRFSTSKVLKSIGEDIKLTGSAIDTARTAFNSALKKSVPFGQQSAADIAEGSVRAVKSLPANVVLGKSLGTRALKGVGRGALGAAIAAPAIGTGKLLYNLASYGTAKAVTGSPKKKNPFPKKRKKKLTFPK